MRMKAEKWLDKMLPKAMPEDVIAFCFNLYEETDGRWAMEVVGTDAFDSEDEDWACEEITDFATRNKPFRWKQKGNWEDALRYMTAEVQRYLEKGRNAPVLLSAEGVGVGFSDGNIVILHQKSMFSE